MAKKNKTKRRKTRKQILGEWSQSANWHAVHAMAPGTYWFIARSEPQKETVAHRILTQRGIAAFLPLKTRYRRRNKYVKDKDHLIIPQVPGYIFIECNGLREYWHEFTDQGVVRGIVGCDGHAMRISSEILQSFIMSKVMNLHTPGEHRFMHSHKEFAPGDHVEIVEGAFLGHIVDVKSITGRHASIFMEIFGAMQEIQIPVDFLEKVA
jgi:transcription antitermination factor NusG